MVTELAPKWTSPAQEAEVLDLIKQQANVSAAVSVKELKRLFKRIDVSLIGDDAARETLRQAWDEITDMAKNTDMLSAVTVGAILGERAAVQQLRELADAIRYQNVNHPLVRGLVFYAHGEDEYNRQMDAYAGTAVEAIHKLQTFLISECGMAQDPAFHCARYFILRDETSFKPTPEQKNALGEWLGEVWGQRNGG